MPGSFFHANPIFNMLKLSVSSSPELVVLL